jgi:hypothetical protein
MCICKGSVGRREHGERERRERRGGRKRFAGAYHAHRYIVYTQRDDGSMPAPAARLTHMEWRVIVRLEMGGSVSFAEGEHGSARMPSKRVGRGSRGALCASRDVGDDDTSTSRPAQDSSR